MIDDFMDFNGTVLRGDIVSLKNDRTGKYDDFVAIDTQTKLTYSVRFFADIDTAEEIARQILKTVERYRETKNEDFEE